MINSIAICSNYEHRNKRAEPEQDIEMHKALR